HRPDRVRGRAEYFDLADHDGHGEDKGYCRAHVAGNEEGADPPRLHRAGRADWRNRHSDWPRARVCDLMGRRTLPLHFALARGLFDRLRAVRTAADRWSDRGAGVDRDFVCGHNLSVMVGGADSARRSVALRIGGWGGAGGLPPLIGAKSRYHTIPLL